MEEEKKEKKKDLIDRHSKKRAILIDDKLLLNNNIQDYIHEIIDINEVSDYYDTIIVSTDVEYIKKYLVHWGLSSLVYEKYTSYNELKKVYRFLLLFTTKQELKKMKQYYQCEVLSR